MGMSASQARLLSLTSRLSDLELRAQVISNAKIRLADESTQASDDYEKALDKKQFQVMTGVDQNGDNTYSPASAYNLMNYDPSDVTSKPRFIEDSAGRVLVTDNTVTQFQKGLNSVKSLIANGTWPVSMGTKTADQYKAMPLDQLEKDATFVEFVSDMENRPKADPNDTTPYGFNDYLALVQKLGTTKMQYYQNLFIQMVSGNYTAPGDNNLKNPAWLDGQVNGGNLYLYEQQKQADGTTPFVNISWTSGDDDIQEVTDSTDTARAEAKYEATMADINSKDKRFDLQLKNIDTEHEATQTEIDSVKKVIDKNIERAFKMFQA